MLRHGIVTKVGGHACVLAAVWLSGCGDKAKTVVRPPVGSTPIVASGGSIRFTSLTPWNCNASRTRCITTPSATLGDIDSEQLAGWGGEDTIQRRPWVVNFQPFSGGTAPSAGDMLALCPTSGANPDNATCGSAGSAGVLLRTFEGTSLVPSAVSGSSVVQYFDPMCPVHGKVNPRGFDDPPATLPGCELPKSVTFVIDNQSASHLYTCLDGNCQVYFYQ